MEKKSTSDLYKQVFKKKAKFIKKNNLFNFEKKSLNEIYEFLSFINGFNNYKEFIKSLKNINDPRLDFLDYKYKANIDRQVTLIFQWIIKNNINDEESISKEFKNNPAIHGFITRNLYRNLLILDGDSKTNSMYRKFNFKKITNLTQSIPVLITMTDLNNLFSNKLISRIIKTKKDSNTKIFNLTNIDYNFGKTNYTYFKTPDINLLYDYCTSKLSDRHSDKQPAIKANEKENIFIILDNEFSDEFKTLSTILTQSRTLFNVFIFNSLSGIKDNDTSTYKRIIGNTEKMIVISSPEEHHLEDIILLPQYNFLKDKIRELPIGAILTTIRQPYSVPSISIYESYDL